MAGSSEEQESPRRYVSILQGLYFLVTGVWPLVSIKTFMMITGPKRDTWLVKTVGVVVAVIGAVLLLAGLRRRSSPELTLLATGSAASLAGIDVVYVARGTIPPVYLLDAAAELLFIAGWLFGGARSRRAP